MYKNNTFLKINCIVFAMMFSVISFTQDQIPLCSFDHIKNNVKNVQYKVRKDLVIGAGLTGFSVYVSCIPLINLYNAMCLQTKDEPVEHKNFIGHVVSIGKGIVGIVFSEQLFISAGTAVCTGLAGWMAQRIAGRVCYAQSLQDFAHIYAPWEYRKKVVKRYLVALCKKSLDEEKRAFYKKAFIASMKCLVNDIEMLFAYVEYKVLLEKKNEEACLNNAIALYLVGMSNHMILRINELLQEQEPDYTAILEQIDAFFDDFKIELAQGGW